MIKVTFDEAFTAAAQCPDYLPYIIYHDKIINGLILQCMRSGRKTFYLLNENGGKMRWRKIAPYGSIPFVEVDRRARALRDFYASLRLDVHCMTSDEH